MARKSRFVLNELTGVAHVATETILSYLHKKNLKNLRLMPENWKPGDSVEIDNKLSHELPPDVLQAIAEGIAKRMPDADAETIRLAVAEATGQAPPPEGDVIKLADPNAIQEVIAAISEMDKDNTDEYTNGGKPDAKVLSQRLGRNVSASERDEAFDLFSAPIVE